jgi:hypothetical protein
VHLTIPAERASRIKLWILIPCRSLNALAPHHITLLGTLRQHGIWYSLRTLPGDSLITRARNNLADIFLRESTDDDHHFALWLDDDVIFHPESVLQMLALDLDFVAVPYTKKGLHMDRMQAAATLGWKSSDLESVSGTPNVNFLVNTVHLDMPTPVLESGSGFWLHKRKVLTMMVNALPHIRYRRTQEEKAHYGSDYAYDFFRVGVWPDTQEYLSEDWWFCREWRKLGGVVHCCFWIHTQHLGPHMYQMNMDAIIGLLNQTGGYIHGATWPDKETNHATTQIANDAKRRTGPSDGATNGRANGRDTLFARALAALQNEANEAAVPRHPGPLGG